MTSSQPFVCRQLIDRYAWHHIRFEHSSDKLLTRLTGSVLLGTWKRPLLLHLYLKHLRKIRVIEGHQTSDGNEEDDAETPGVGQHRVVGRSFEHFRCHVGCTSAVGLAEQPAQCHLIDDRPSETKVRQLCLQILVQKNVLALEVTVRDVACVAELQLIIKTVKYTNQVRSNSQVGEQEDK